MTTRQTDFPAQARTLGRAWRIDELACEQAILAAENDKAIGQGYNCSTDGDLTLEQYYNAIADALGEPRPKRHIPYGVAYSLAFLLECWGHLIGKKKPPLVTRYSVWLMGRRCFFSADKARRELGWEPTVPILDGLRTTRDYFRNALAQESE